MMMYEFTAAYPTGWVGPRDCPVILSGNGYRYLHHSGWSWGTSCRVWAQSDGRHFCQDNSAFQVFSSILTLKSCVQRLCGLYGLRLMPSHGFAAFWHVLCVGSSVPLGLRCSSQSTSYCVSEKFLSTLLRPAFRIFEVSPTSGSAFFDLAMSETTAESEASWE